MTEDELKREVEIIEAEVRLLKSAYDLKVNELKQEVSFQNEKLMAQQDMLKIAVDYVDSLGKELKAMKRRIDCGDFKSLH